MVAFDTVVATVDGIMFDMVDITVVAIVDNNVVLKVAFATAFWIILLWGRS